MQGNFTKLFDDKPTKQCRCCKQLFPLSAFRTVTCKKRYGVYQCRYSYCDACCNAKTLAYSRTPRGKAVYRKNWIARYGITPEEYEAMYQVQGGVCAICKQPEPQIRKHTSSPQRLSIDHAHDETKRVRGLLCSHCNRAVGLMRDDPALLRAAADYLLKTT